MAGYKISRVLVNRALFAMLGREELVNNWWNSPNMNWELQTPDQVWERDPEEVTNYVMSHLQK